MKLYELIYYRLFCIIDKFSDGSISHISAAVFFALLQVTICFLILMMGEYWGYYSRSSNNDESSLLDHIIGLAIFSVNIYIVLKNDRYKRIIKKYSNDSYSIKFAVVDALLILLVILVIGFAIVLDDKYPA